MIEQPDMNDVKREVRLILEAISEQQNILLNTRNSSLFLHVAKERAERLYRRLCGIPTTEPAVPANETTKTNKTT